MMHFFSVFFFNSEKIYEFSFSYSHVSHRTAAVVENKKKFFAYVSFWHTILSSTHIEK